MLFQFLLFFQQTIWYQQDGAGPHTYIPAREHLTQEFPQRWIGKYSNNIDWPARSPDLTPLDFYYWPVLKNKLFTGQEYQNLAELRERILEISASFTPQQNINAINDVNKRLQNCLAAGGAIFEHLRL